VKIIKFHVFIVLGNPKQFESCVTDPGAACECLIHESVYFHCLRLLLYQVKATRQVLTYFLVI
jgi:hypothetical protein